MGRGGATKRVVLISWPSHLRETAARMRAAMSSSVAPARGGRDLTPGMRGPISRVSMARMSSTSRTLEKHL